MAYKNTKEKKNPTAITFSLRAFFRAYTNAIQAKALFFRYPFRESALTRKFLKCLEKESRIAGYHFVKDKSSVDIFLSYDLAEKMSLNSKFIFYSSTQRKRVATLDILEQFNNQNPTALTLINTNKGLMTLKDCLQQKCGGEFLVTIL